MIAKPLQTLPLGCPERCPGCQHRCLTSAESAEKKYHWLQHQLEPWKTRLDPIRLCSESLEWGYRSKACFHAQWSEIEQRWHFGLRVRVPGGKIHETEVIDIPDCPVHTAFIRKVVHSLSHQLPPPHLLPLVYLVFSGKLLTLVVKSAQLAQTPKIDWIGLGLSGVWLNLHPSAGHRVFSHRGWKLIWGEELSLDHGMVHGPASFQQLLGDLHEDSLNEAQRFLEVSPSACVIDLYSGVGRSLLRWQSAGAPYLGVELSGEAVRCAEINLKKPMCLRGKASDRIPQLDSWVQHQENLSPVCYVNPPRLGIEQTVVSWLTKKVRPLRIAYLSCSAGTLKRDLIQFEKSGYSIQRIIPYDFFPKTHHVETLALLDLSIPSSTRSFSESSDLCRKSGSLG